MLLFRQGKEFLKISKKSWLAYLQVINKDYYDNSLKSEKYCGLKNKYSNYCYACNSQIGNWNNNCSYIINTLNLKKYDYILLNKNNNENKEFVFIEVDRNDSNNNTI